MKITEAFEGPAKELGSQSELPISSTAQHSSISLTPTIPMSNISVECYNKTLAKKVRAIDEKRNKKKATKRNKDYANDANILSK